MNAPELLDKEVYDNPDQTVAGFDKSEKAVRKAWGDLERRAKPRVQEQFPARIWGLDSGELPFNFDCVIDNISSTGLYLRLPRQIPPGTVVRLIVHLLNGPTSGASARISGEILRDEPQLDGKHGIAVAIKGHKFL
jgi:hypothetical protein